MAQHHKGLLFHRLLNGILAILYIPWAFLCSLAGLVQDGLIGETNVFLLISGQIVTWCGLIVAFSSHGCLYLSDTVYHRGKRGISYVIRFLPVIIMVAAFGIFAIAETLANR